MSQPSPIEVARGVLEPGEELVWAGRPSRQGYVWRRGARLRFWLPVGMLALAFTLLIISATTGLGASYYNNLKVPFLLVVAPLAFFALFGTLPVFIRSITHSAVVYVVTNRRLLEVMTNSSKRARAFQIDEMPIESLEVADRVDGYGVVRFGKPVISWIERLLGVDVAGFYGIEDPDGLLALISRQRFYRSAVGELEDVAPPSSAERFQLSGPKADPETKATQAITQHLAPGERLLWSGTRMIDNNKMPESPAQLILGALPLLFGLWGLFELSLVPSYRLPSVAKLVYLIPLGFAGIGALMIGSHFRWRRRNPSPYIGVTQERLLLVDPRGGIIKDIPLRAIRQIRAWGQRQKEGGGLTLWVAEPSGKEIIILPVASPITLRSLMMSLPAMSHLTGPPVLAASQPTDSARP